MTKGEVSTMANAYEPGLITSSNPYNTQATRDVASGKKGVVGNARAGDKVYNPKTTTRNKVAASIKARQKKQQAGILSRSKQGIQ